VNLIDGFETDPAAELHAVFACLNAQGALDGYAPLDAALDARTRTGTVAIAVGDLLTAAPDADISLSALAEGLADALDDPSEARLPIELGLELMYAAPYDALGTSVTLNDEGALARGAVVPLLPVIGAASGALLDDDLASIGLVSDALRSPLTERLVWTLASTATSDDAALRPLGSGWAPGLAQALRLTTDASNDRWDEASGDSLRDLAGALLLDTAADGRPNADLLSAPILELLADANVRSGARDLLTHDHLPDVIPGLAHLSNVDIDGGALSDGEDSALVALLRLLDAGNTEVRCGIDLGLFEIDVSLGNLSVALVGALADLDPDTAVSGVDLLAEILGTDISAYLLEQVAASGVCPVIDETMVRDLGALDRLSDPETDGLFRFLLAVLDAGRDRIDAIVELAGVLHVHGLVPPVEEAVRDLDGSLLVDAIVAFLPSLADPYAHHDGDFFPAGVDPIDVDAAFTLVEAVLSEDADGRTPLQMLSGPVAAIIGHDGTWTALHNLEPLLDTPDSRLAAAGPWFAGQLASDPDGEAFAVLADTIETPELVRPLLLIAEADGFREAVARTELLQPGPLPTTASLVCGGTLDELLDTLRILVTLLPETSE
jgi:hypothetical protein